MPGEWNVIAFEGPEFTMYWGYAGAIHGMDDATRYGPGEAEAVLPLVPGVVMQQTVPEDTGMKDKAGNPIMTKKRIDVQIRPAILKVRNAR